MGFPRAHPTQTSSSSATIELRSLNGTLHRVDAAALRKHSGLFDTMLSLPKPSPSAIPEPPIDVFEHDTVLTPTLKLISNSSGTSSWTDIIDADGTCYYRVLELCDKWDCPRLTDHFRDHFFPSLPQRKHPLRLYALARHFNWTTQARWISKFTLSLDFSAAENAQMLAQMHARDAAALVELRRRRCLMFTKMLDSPMRFTGGNSSLYFCDTCCCAHAQDDLWHTFKRALRAELERMPSGDKLLSLVAGGVQEAAAAWPEAEACWGARCGTPGCGAARFDKTFTLLQIRACLEALPCHIE